MGKQARGRRERKTKMPQWQEDDSASLLQSTTRAGTAYLRPATKEDVKDVDVTAAWRDKYLPRSLALAPSLHKLLPVPTPPPILAR
jgi:hypothetical protein